MSRPGAGRGRLVLGAAGAAALGAVALVASVPLLTKAEEREKPAPVVSRRAFAGPGACVSCHDHGGTRPGPDDSYAIWADHSSEGSHAGAGRVLYGERSQRIVELLYGRAPTEKDPWPAASSRECLTCHAVAGGAVVGPAVMVDDGVSCEACHGPATGTGLARGWLDRHYAEWWRDTTKGGYPSAAVLKQRDKLGFKDLRSLTRRAEACLSCHTAANDRGLDHAMLAAGHPDVRVDLARDLAGAPIHWRQTRSYLRGEDPPAHRARLWAVGQAMALAASAERLAGWADRAARSKTMDLAIFSCSACHHGLLPSDRSALKLTVLEGGEVKPDAETGAVPGRGADPAAIARQGAKAERRERLGDSAPKALDDPRVDLSALAVTRALAGTLWSGEEGAKKVAALEAHARALEGSVRLAAPALDAIRKDARALAALARELAAAAELRLLDPPLRRAVLERLAKDADRIAASGYRAAQQASSALEALSTDHWMREPVAKAIGAVRAHLFDTSTDPGSLPSSADERPGRYDPQAFSALLKAAVEAMR